MYRTDALFAVRMTETLCFRSYSKTIERTRDCTASNRYFANNHKHLRMALCLLVKSYFRTFSPSAKIFSLSNLKFLSAAAILLFFNKGSSKRRLFTWTTVGWLISEPWRGNPRLGRQTTTACDQIEWFHGLNPCACDDLGLFVTSQLLFITNKPPSIVAVFVAFGLRDEKITAGT